MPGPGGMDGLNEGATENAKRDRMHCRTGETVADCSMALPTERGRVRVRQAHRPAAVPRTA